MTYTKEEARIKITNLVEDFRTHEATLEKAAEAQIENNFIRSLFRYLNCHVVPFAVLGVLREDVTYLAG